MNGSRAEALEDENVALAMSALAARRISTDAGAYQSLEDQARDIIRRAVALGRSLERHPSNR